MRTPWSTFRSWPLWAQLAVGLLGLWIILAYLGEFLLLVGLACLGAGLIGLFRPYSVGALRVTSRAMAAGLVLGGLALSGVGSAVMGPPPGESEDAVAQAPTISEAATSTSAGSTSSSSSSTTATSTTTRFTSTISPVAASLPQGRDVEVERIIDGDTVAVTGGERVRLIGIDSPEPSQDACYAREATNFIASLIPPGTDIRLVGDVEGTDRFGRTLAYLYRLEDGLFVNAEMMAAGYAQVLTIPPNVAHAEEFQSLGQQARQAELGLWSACQEEATTTTAQVASGGQVGISAINFDAPGNDNENKNGEWVRIGNGGSGSVDLTGWRLEDEGPNHVYRFPGGFSLSPGAEVTVYTGCGQDSATVLYWCKSGSAVWNNSGDTASLFDAGGTLVDSRSG